MQLVRYFNWKLFLARLSLAGLVFLSMPPIILAAPEPVNWTSLVNALASGSTIVSNSPCNCGFADASAISSQAISSGNGYFEFQVSSGNWQYSDIGLGMGSNPMPFYIALSEADNYTIWESGAYRDEGKYTAGDTFKIAYESSGVKYYKNGNLIFSSNKSPVYPVKAQVSFQAAGVSLLNANFDTNTTSPIPTPTPTPIPAPTPTPTPIPAPVATSSLTGTADPTLLPKATGQIPPSAVPNIEAGTYYNDPTSGVKVWRATSVRYPCSNNINGSFHDYGDVLQISGDLGDNKHTLYLHTCGEYKLVDFVRGQGFSNWRSLASDAQPAHDLSFTFSYNSATPYIAYVTTNIGQLVRYNTITNKTEIAGLFPKTWTGTSWLQNDKNDAWFVANTENNAACVAFNSVTGQTITKTITNFDECHLENNGRWVELNTGQGNDYVWDLINNSIKPFNPPSPTNIFHLASPSGFFTAVDVNTGGGITPTYRLNPVDGSALKISDFGGYITGIHMSGTWLQKDTPDTSQWFSMAAFGEQYPVGTPIGYIYKATGFMRLDGSDVRFLAHTFHDYSNGEYWEIPFTSCAADGKVCFFNSNMGGHGDVYVVEVPLSNGGTSPTPTPTPVPAPAPTPTPTPPPPTTELNNYSPTGSFDGVKTDKGQVYGWAKDQDDLSKPIDVHMYFDINAGRKGAVAYTCKADNLRSDVGYHAFNCAIPSNFFDGRRHKVWVWGIDLGTNSNKQLSGSPRYFRISPESVLGVNTSVTNSPTGSLDGVKSDTQQIFGWAMDKDDSAQAIDVHLYFDINAGSPGAEPYLCKADIERSDVGAHAFNCPIPEKLVDGKEHKVWAWGIDLGTNANRLLNNSPLYLH